MKPLYHTSPRNPLHMPMQVSSGHRQNHTLKTSTLILNDKWEVISDNRVKDGRYQKLTSPYRVSSSTTSGSTVAKVVSSWHLPYRTYSSFVVRWSGLLRLVPHSFVSMPTARWIFHEISPEFSLNFLYNLPKFSPKFIHQFILNFGKICTKWNENFGGKISDMYRIRLMTSPL